MENSIGELWYIENNQRYNEPYSQRPSDVERAVHCAPREHFRLTRKEMATLIKEHGGVYCQTIASYLSHAFSYLDIEQSIEALRRNQAWLFKAGS
ncbi:MAG: hypothetical protein ABSG67_11435 [Thermoguttaceae bacterium]|jgi:hypothetical protein